jgi:hypothetical protein
MPALLILVIRVLDVHTILEFVMIMTHVLLIFVIIQPDVVLLTFNAMTTMLVQRILVILHLVVNMNGLNVMMIICVQQIVVTHLWDVYTHLSFVLIILLAALNLAILQSVADMILLIVTIMMLVL